MNPLERGRLNIIAHVREELERAAIPFESILCKFGGTTTPRDTVRLSVCSAGTTRHVDLKVDEVEECEALVVGEPWYRIADFIAALR